MSGLLIACLLWVGMCAGFGILAAMGAGLDKLCDKFPKLAEFLDK